MKLFHKLFFYLSKIPLGAKSAAVYTAATVFTRGLAIITVPIFTRIMTTEEIGIVNLFNSWHGILSVVVTLSLTSGGFAVAMKEYAEKRDEYISSIQTLTSLVSLLFCVVYFFAPTFWGKLIGLPSSLMMVMIASFIFEPARDFWMARQRYEYKYKIPGAVSVLSALFASLISIIVVVNMRKLNSGHLAEGRLIANYIVVLGVALVIWIYQFRKGRTFINREFWVFSLKLSIPLIGYQFAAQILNVSDRLMIDRYIGKSAVGIYGTLYSVSSISLLVWNAINTSFVPYLFQNIDKKEHKIKEISFTLLETYAIVAVLITFLAPEIVRILATEEYYMAIYIMPPISAGIFFTSVAHMYSNILVYYRKTQYVMYGASIAAFLNIALNAIFIKRYGYMAAAYTTLIGYIIMASLEAYWANKVHKQKSCFNEPVYFDKRIMFLSVVTVIVTLAGLIFYKNNVLRYGIIIIGSIFSIILLKKVFREKYVNKP